MAVGTQKEKMIKEYEADLEAAHEKAQAELRRKRKKKKGLGWLGFGDKTVSGLFPSASSKFMRNIGKHTTLAHLAQPTIDPLQELLMKNPRQGITMQGIQAPKLPRRRY